MPRRSRYDPCLGRYRFSSLDEWFVWFASKIEAEVHEESERQRSQQQQQRDARRLCARCGQPFRLLFNKRFVCRLCSAGVCRRCATYETGHSSWVCSVCQRERELQANKWLSEIQLRHRVSIRTPGCRLSDSEDDSGYDPSVTHDEPPRQQTVCVAGEEVTPVPGDPDRVTSEVRGHLENVVETLLGESIQNASIRPAASESALYREYHPALVAAIDKLTQSLSVTLQNRPPDQSSSPTTALAELKSVLQQAQEASMRLPILDEVDPVQVTSADVRDSLTSPDGCGEEPNSHTYEEILATAVLSRLGEKARRAAAVSFCDAAVQSDDVTPVECDVIGSLGSAAPAAGGPDGQSKAAGGEEPLEDGDGGVLEITIEEEIEEILTYEDGEATTGGVSATETGTETETETETEGEGADSRRASLASTLCSANSGDDVSLPGPSISYGDLDFTGGQSVPFPELGRSLPEVSPLEEDPVEEPGGTQTSWEENWLFRRRRLTQPNRLLGEDPVPMLVPDPSQPMAITVGSRDIDELSELSERGSESSLDDWTAGDRCSPAAAVTDRHHDVTDRLRAARDADRDRYLTAAQLTHSPRRGSAGPPDPVPADSGGERRSSAGPVTISSAGRDARPAVTTAGTSSPESSLSRAISWSSVPSDVELAFSAVSERLAAGSPPSLPQLPPPVPQTSTPAPAAAGADSGPARTGTASSATKRELSAAERTVPGASSQRTASSAAERTTPSPSPSSASSSATAVSQSTAGPAEAARTREDTSPAGGGGAVQGRPSRPAGGGGSPQPEDRRVSVPAGVGTELMAQAGNIAQLRCRVPVSENSETHWLRDGVMLEPGERHQMYRVRDQHHLLVYGVTRKDAGRFSCLVVNGDAETWHHFTLRVLGSGRPAQQPRFSVGPEDRLRPVNGAALRLAVRVVGHPEPRVTFLRDDRPLTPSDTVTIERHSGGEWVLAVQPVRPADSGQYGVRAVNRAGSSSRQFQVEVQPPPEATLSPLPPPLSPPPPRQPVQPRPVRPVPTVSLSPVTSASVSPVTSPPGYVTSRDEALKETSLTEACNSVILRARPVRVRSPADGGRDSESDGAGEEEEEEQLCLPRPPPGTIAEREHRKWENAVAMPNNPYTLERVRQRRRSRPLDRTGYYSAAHYSSGEDVSDHDVISTSTDPSNKINCGLKSINSERYRRDYYINAGAGSRWSSLPPTSRRQGAGGSTGGGGVSSRPVSALSEEPLPPLSVRGSSDDLRSTGAGSVYHSSESLAVTERVSSASPSAAASTTGSGGGGTVERRPSTRSSAASPAVGEDELPPEGTVRSAVERMQQLSRSAEELAGRRPRLTASGDAADGRSTLSASPSVPVMATPTPPPPPSAADHETLSEGHQERHDDQEVRRSPLYVQVEEDSVPPPTEEQEQEQHQEEAVEGRRSGGLEQRPSPDGRESLGSPTGSDLLPPQLPSVKELRSHFQAGGAPPIPQKQESPLYNSSVLIIEKADQESEAWDEPRELRKVEKLRKKTSNHKVHSLTARSVSREFREGLKLGAPLSLHSGNIRDPGLLSGQRSSGAGDCAGQQRQPQEGHLEMAPGVRLVASRAAFWDRKVAQELS